VRGDQFVQIKSLDIRTLGASSMEYMNHDRFLCLLSSFTKFDCSRLSMMAERTSLHERKSFQGGFVLVDLDTCTTVPRAGQNFW
jgi:hypothetical protein